MGKKNWLPARLSAQDESSFPNLKEYRVTSPKDATYNCVAYAAGETSKKWSPTLIPIPGYYWPPGARQDDHPEALKSAFEAIGYEVCSSGDLEEGYEKVALYVDDNGDWSHAAKQEMNGEWSSKLGDEEDICHNGPHCFGGSLYGSVVFFMRRRIRDA